MSEDQLFLFGFMAAVLIAGITYMLILPILAAQKRVRKRINEVIGEGGARMAGVKVAAESAQRKRQVADTLRVIDERRKSQAKVSLRTRIDRAGLSIEPKMFWMISGVCGVERWVVWLVAVSMASNGPRPGWLMAGRPGSVRGHARSPAGESFEGNRRCPR